MNLIAALGRALAAALVLLAAAAPSAADPTLMRHGVFGVATADRSGRVTVLAVVPGSAAAAAGLATGDVLVSVDGTPVANVHAFLAAIRRPAGQVASIVIDRAGTLSSVSVTLRPPPNEHDPGVTTEYGVVPFLGTLRRAIVTSPENARGKHPAVLVIGGIGCYSVDVASNAADPYMNLTHDLARKGFVAMRLEKSGVGDSQGPPCDGVDFATESASYEAALQTLAQSPAVDPNKIYLFGHSIGSIIGPRLAVRNRVAGLVVAEGVGRDWFEYELINARGQLSLGGLRPEQVDAEMLPTATCKYRVLIGKEPVQQVLRDRPDCGDYISYPVPAAYLQQLAVLNVAEPWTKLAMPVLLVYGTSDFETTEADHHLLFAIVNGAHPGNATLRIIDGMDHLLTPAATQQASYDRDMKGGRGPYDPRFSQTIIEWLCARERCS